MRIARGLRGKPAMTDIIKSAMTDLLFVVFVEKGLGFVLELGEGFDFALL